MNAGVTGLVCAGFNTGNISLSVSGGVSPYTYLWSPGSQTTDNISNLGAGTYSVAIRDANNCTTNRSYSISTYPAIGDNTIIGAQTLCEGGQTMNLTGSSPSGGDGSFTYLWLSSGNNLNWAAAGSTSQNFASVSLSDTTWYRRIVSSCAQNDTSNVLMMDVRVLASAPILSASQDTVCSTGHTLLQVSGNLNSATQWQWYFNSCGGQNAGTGTNNPLQTLVQRWMYARGEGNGCIGPCDSIQITPSFPIGNNSISGAQSLCGSGTVAALTGSTPSGGVIGFTYNWQSSSDQMSWSNTGIGQVDYPSYTANDTAYYRRIVSDGGFCAADTSNTIFIDVRQLADAPAITVASDSVCITDHAILNIAGNLHSATQWQWHFSSCGGQNAGTGTSLPLQTLVDITMYARGIGNGCQGPCDTIRIYAINPHGDNTISAHQTLCAPGTPASLSGSMPSGGNGHYIYNWQSSTNMSTWSHAGGSNMNFQPGFISVTTYYRRIVSSIACVAHTSNVIQVLVAPIVNIISSNQTINYEGIPSGFTGITNAQAPTYVWEISRNNFHWNLIPGAGNANYAQSNPLTQWAWYRRKIAVSGCDTSISNVVIVQLNNLLNDSITLSSNGPICTPTPVYLSVQTPLTRLTHFNWTGPNGFTATGVNPSIMQSLEIHRGVYRCVALDTATNDSFVSTIHVYVSPIMSSLNVAYNQPVCEGSTLQLSAAGMPGVAYSWTGPNGFTSDQFLNRLTGANSSMNGVYSLIASSPGCGSTSRSLSVNIHTIPNPMPGSNGPICTSNVLNLTASIPAGSSATWSGPNGFASSLYQPSINNAQTIHAGVYTLNVSRPGCQSVIQTTTVQVNTPVAGISVSSNSPVCQSGTLQLSATASTAQYQWSGPNGFNSTTISPSLSNVSSLQNGVYTLQVVSPGCGSISRTMNVQIITPGSINAGSNSPICAGTTLVLTSTSIPGATVLWQGPNGFNSNISNPSIGGAQTIRSGVYTVTVTSPGCTPSVGTTTVTVSSSVSSLVAVANSPVCEGSAINLSVPMLNGVTYAWTGPQSFTASGNTASVPNAAVANAGNYVLSMTTPGCASVNRTLNVVVRSSTAAIAGSNTPLCTGSVLNLTVNTIAGATYVWQGPNGFTSTQQNPSLSNVQPVQSGNYSLTVSFAGCGSATQTIPVVIFPNATGIQISAAQTLCSGSSLTLTGTSVSGATMSWVGPNSFTASGSSISVPVTTVANAGRYAYSVVMPGCQAVQRNSNVTIMNGAAVNGVISTPLCTGAAMYMDAAFIAGATYQWQAPDGFSSTQKSPSRIRVTVPMAGVYTLSVNVPGCGIVSQTIAVTINVCREGDDVDPSEPNLEMLTEAELKLNVYPNPFARELSYTSSGLSLVRVQLLDLNGRVMHQITQPESNGIIPDTESLPAGAYFLRFETAQGYRVVKVMRQ